MDLRGHPMFLPKIRGQLRHFYALHTHTHTPCHGWFPSGWSVSLCSQYVREDLAPSPVYCRTQGGWVCFYDQTRSSIIWTLSSVHTNHIRTMRMVKSVLSLRMVSHVSPGVHEWRKQLRWAAALDTATWRLMIILLSCVYDLNIHISSLPLQHVHIQPHASDTACLLSQKEETWLFDLEQHRHVFFDSFCDMMLWSHVKTLCCLGGTEFRFWPRKRCLTH